MKWIYFTDDEGVEVGVPLKRITELELEKAADGDPKGDCLTITVKGDEYYEVSGNAARETWDEIRKLISKSDEP